jgi:SPP1 family predicted phage head-tail adaptor
MAKHVTAADLTRQITIEHRIDAANSRGEPVPTWSALHTGVWAQKQPIRGREYFAAGQMQTPADVRFRIRYRADITAAMRVVDGGQPFDIVGEPIDVDGARITLELMCTTGVRDGR